MKLNHVVISSPTGLPDDTVVTIDGNKMEHLTKVGLFLRPDSFTEVHLTMLASVEAEFRLVERVFEAPKEANG